MNTNGVSRNIQDLFREFAARARRSSAAYRAISSKSLGRSRKGPRGRQPNVPVF
jgi:hypothetical protein